MDENQPTKQERRELAIKKHHMRKTVGWIIAVLIIGGAGYGLYYLASQPEKPRPGEAFSILGQEHISVGASHPTYNSNPPTSGSHYAQPANWGIYQEELPDEQLIHNLEHGGIWISYKDVDQETKSNLEVIGKKYPGGVVVTPRSANDTKIILASWGRLERLESFNETQILDFVKANRNKSPEPLAR